MSDTTSSHADSSADDLPRDRSPSEEPGIGGTIKSQPEDFEVEEIPAYEPIGEGEHLFLWIEKRDRSHEQMTWRITKTLGIPQSAIGVAGVKDRRAVTRQYVSVPAGCQDRVPSLDGDGISVLHAKLHRNKLKRGHLRGNRFSILVRDVVADAEPRARQTAERLQRLGFPNYFGDQRFGVEDSTLHLGYALLAGDKTPRDLSPSRRRFLLSMSLSAVQSDLFNLALAQRITDGLLRTVLLGDVMLVVASGGRFVVEDLAREQARFEAGETTISGPLFGPEMLVPQGEPAVREARLLERRGLQRDAFLQFAKLTAGTRRAMLVHPQDLQVIADPAGLRVTFALPSGVYATSLLREVM